MRVNRFSNAETPETIPNIRMKRRLNTSGIVYMTP